MKLQQRISNKITTSNKQNYKAHSLRVESPRSY